MPHLVVHLGARFGTSVHRWAERSQQRACRNAMIASTAMTRARVERDEVEAYVAGTLARRADAEVDVEVVGQVAGQVVVQQQVAGGA